MAKSKIPHKRVGAKTVRRLLSYDPLTGILTWNYRVGGSPQWNGTFAGKQAGSLGTNGYVKVAIFRRHYLASRIIWLWMTGRWPKNEVDHEDGHRSNNRWNNLRNATISQQRYNRRISRNNTSGFKWVVKQASGLWAGQIMAKGKLHHTEEFEAPELAYAASCELAKKLHGVFVRFA